MQIAGHGMTEPESKPVEVAPGGEPRRRNRMDRFIDGIELLAAFFVGIVAADIFISVLLRYFFSVQIPDSYDFGRLLLGILIFWGIAATSYRGTHITVDLLYANVGPKLQRFIDVFATLVLLFVVSVQTWTLFDKVVSTRADNVLTFDLRLPTWPFFLVAWLGDVSAVLLIAVRTYRLIFQPELMGGQYQIKPVE
jgi:TRAP-type transport system small permease protein